MKFLDLFSGIGGFRLGLQRAGHTPVGYVEIDKFARQSYQAMYDTSSEWTAEDIFKVTDEQWSEFNGKVELIAGGFPCQSFSIAGKREGFLNQTKGTLFFEVARAVKQIKPRFVFLENVKGLLNHDGGNTFRTILNTFDELGYDVEWRLLNSKDFGVPQNRERVYIIGHLRGDGGREVLSIFGEDDDVNSTIIKQIGNISDKDNFGGNPQTGRVYGINGLSPTLNTMQGGGREPKVMVKEATRKGYDIAIVGDSINVSQPNSKTRRGRVGHGIANTLLTGPEQAVLTSEYRIRKLTPRECWRLQAFPDELFDKAQEAGLSDSQLYKQAGNSVTVNVIEYIGHLLEATHEI
ncbi:DNA cytosine methyltransferase [Leuconostoc lactis]|uniref:Cytosine-specific methyltransferase n=1 Tax=Leuconostoc lactis TaxID=1246 RepID=A0AAP9EAN7_LEULA|nr:DNA cytosine methyltransferase [Leuconostoc lactis]QEA43275.1 DNA cytosine methyltransferase [Leuconostoc lactis]